MFNCFTVRKILTLGGESLKAALSAALLLTLWGGPARAQLQTPPPLDSFAVQSQNSTLADDDGLTDFYLDAVSDSGGYTPYPAAPPASTGGPLTPPPSAVQAESLEAAAPSPFQSPLSPVSSAPPLPPSVEPLPTAVESRPLGQNLPAPAWDDSSSQGTWIQLEIGQADAFTSSSASGPITPPPSSISSLPQPPVDPAQPAVPRPGAADPVVDQAMDRAIQAPAEAPIALEGRTDRQPLRDLFSDMLPPESQSVQGLSQGSPPAAFAPPASVPEVPAPAEPEADSSILRAGDLLSIEGQAGAAEILPPLSQKVDWQSRPAQEKPAAPAPAAKQAETKKENQPAAKSPAKSSSGSSGARGKAAAKPAAKAKAAGPAASSVQLHIINETGSPQTGQLYRSVLSKIGYKVLSVADKAPGGGTTGQTVIQYRPGQRAKAQAVARHLPGKKVLREAGKGEALGAEVMVYIR